MKKENKATGCTNILLPCCPFSFHFHSFHGITVLFSGVSVCEWVWVCVCVCVFVDATTREPFEIITKYSREQDTVKKLG